MILYKEIPTLYGLLTPLLRENFEISKKDILNPPLFKRKFSSNLLSYQEKFPGVFDPRLLLCRKGGRGAEPPPPGKKCKFCPPGWSKWPKMKNLKKWTDKVFCLTFVHNWSKFQLSSSFLAKLVLKNVILRYRDFSENEGFSLILTKFWT